MPSAVPYWNIYTRDWIASSTVSEMSVTAEGIYFRLCLIQWEDGCLSNDHQKLRRLSRATLKEWRVFEPFLDKCFPICGDGCRRNNRIEFDRNVSISGIKKKIDGGKTGAKKRWNKERLGSKDDRIPIANPSENDGIPIGINNHQPPTTNLPTEDKKTKAKKADSQIELPKALTWHVDGAELWESFRQHRRDMKKPMTKGAEILILKKLAKMTPFVARQVLELSIERGWQGLVPGHDSIIHRDFGTENWEKIDPTLKWHPVEGVDYVVDRYEGDQCVIWNMDRTKQYQPLNEARKFWLKENGFYVLD